MAKSDVPLELQHERLRAAVVNVSGLARDGFEKIESLASLALFAMESPRAYNDLEMLATALRSIRDIAGDNYDCVASEAESVGCGMPSDARERRYRAREEA